MSLRVVFMGTPDFSVGIMQKMLAEGIEIAAAVTVADKPAGRGQQLHESAVKKFAVENDIPVLQPVKLKEPGFLARLEEFSADVFVVVAFRMLPAEVWKMPSKGTFNLHASLLPDYRGAAPINWTIINGDTESGVSTFFIDEEIDTGNVIGQVKMPIGENETAGELHDRMIVTGGELVVKTIRAIEAGTVKPVPQNEFSESLKRPAPKLFRENTEIDWSKTAREIHQFILGLSPYPGSWTKWKNAKGEQKQVKIYGSRLEDEKKSDETLKISSDKQFVYIDCIGGRLVITEFQMEGRKRMTAREWLAGNNAADWKLLTK